MSLYRRFLSAAVIAGVLVGGTALSAPNVQAEESTRKIKSKVQPKYPEIARKMNVGGKVRLSVTVAPNGQVTESEVLGGHPVLANAAQDAVKKWKYEPTGQESHLTVEVNFDPTGS